MPVNDAVLGTYGRSLAVQDVRFVDSVIIRPTIITWQRLEPLPRSEDLSIALQAEVADPLWLLGRQWQFAEFLGEDAGSPIAVKLQGEAAHLSRYRPGPVPASGDASADAVDYSHFHLPLEALVEREAVRASHPRLAAEAGEHLLRLLAGTGATHARSSLRGAGFGLDINDASLPEGDPRLTDPKGKAWQTLFARRALDGRLLADALRPFAAGDGTLTGLPPAFTFGGADPNAVQDAAASWLGWYDGFLNEPTPDVGSAWVHDRQEYAFALSAQFADQTAVLAAEEYTDGRLDWYTFSASRGPDLGSPAEPVPTTPVNFRPMLPAPVRYPGMPADRYWEFEDGRVNLGSLEAGPTDLGRMLLVEYALVYGNDWFVIPVELEVGSLFHVSRLTVRDTFGVTSNVGPARNLDGTRWTIFSLTNTPGGLADLFFLPPSLPSRLEGDPFEEVALFRDEMANMAWAVERKVQGASGEARDRRMEPYIPSVYQRVTGDQVSADLIYRLATPVPQQWLPFVPVPAAPNQPPSAFGIALERRAILRVYADGTTEEVHPDGILMRTDLSRPVEDEPPLRLHEEEVPREGAVVRRSFQFARWLNGQRFLWAGRSKAVGRGEGASQLRFDVSLYHDNASE
ncbi:hypothetical protein [Aggregatilinea lenta]|uniref:hypothetical protein n=1 Tax=Aggregatilinea lenta TaxID=913108 RepID=UPI000E5C11C5|nr:hypothetical protein [Aggregatilinea lenta]